MTPPGAAVYLIALIAVALWGASAVAAKIAVADMSPWTVAFLRTALGGVLALPIALAARLPTPPTARIGARVLAAAGCGYIAFPVLFTIGVAQTSANHASMILAALPVLSGGIALAWDRRTPSRGWMLGCALALSGEAWLIFGADAVAAATQGATIAGDLWVVASCVFVAAGYVVGARLQNDGYPAVALTFWGVTLASLLIAPALLIDELDILGDAAQASPRSWLAIGFLVIGVTIVGYALWYWALGVGGVARMGVMQFLQPVSGVALAWLLLGESLTPSFLFGAIVILAGVVIAARSG